MAVESSRNAIMSKYISETNATIERKLPPTSTLKECKFCFQLVESSRLRNHFWKFHQRNSKVAFASKLAHKKLLNQINEPYVEPFYGYFCKACEEFFREKDIDLHKQSIKHQDRVKQIEPNQKEVTPLTDKTQ